MTAMKLFISEKQIWFFHAAFKAEGTLVGNMQHILDELYKSKAYICLKMCEEGRLDKKMAVRALASWRLAIPTTNDVDASSKEANAYLEVLRNEPTCPFVDGSIARAIQTLGFQRELCLNDFRKKPDHADWFKLGEDHTEQKPAKWLE